MSYLRNNGFNVTQIDTHNIKTIKKNQGIPVWLESCRTAIVDGYIVEGHVPVNEIRRMLKEKPPIKGIAVPGMPIGSPGMEFEGAAAQPYDVIAFDKSGEIEVFASY